MITYHHRTTIARPASLKKLAYLRYMNVPYPAEMTEEDADIMIANLERVDDYDAWMKLLEKKCAWRTDRFILHPTLFRCEFQIYHEKELPLALKTYLFEMGPSTLRRLSLAKVRECMKELDRNSPQWWQSPRVQEEFMEHYLRREREAQEGEKEGTLPMIWEQMKGAVSMLSALTPSLFKPSPSGAEKKAQTPHGLA